MKPNYLGRPDFNSMFTENEQRVDFNDIEVYNTNNQLIGYIPIYKNWGLHFRLHLER